MEEWTEATGFAEAERHVIVCVVEKSESLDLGGLALQDLPPGGAKLIWLKYLFLGPDFETRNKPHLIYRGRGKKRCNALRALPDALMSALTQFTQLSWLDLSHNNLSELPVAIGTLAGLTPSMSAAHP